VIRQDTHEKTRPTRRQPIRIIIERLASLIAPRESTPLARLMTAYESKRTSPSESMKRAITSILEDEGYSKRLRSELLELDDKEKAILIFIAAFEIFEHDTGQIANDAARIIEDLSLKAGNDTIARLAMYADLGKMLNKRNPNMSSGILYLICSHIDSEHPQTAQLLIDNASAVEWSGNQLQKKAAHLFLDRMNKRNIDEMPAVA